MNMRQRKRLHDIRFPHRWIDLRVFLRVFDYRPYDPTDGKAPTA